MNKASIQSAYLKIQASDEFKQKTISLLNRKTKKQSSHRIRWAVSIAASFVVIVSLVTVFSLLKSGDVFSPQSTVTIPKISPPQYNPLASMIGFVVYNDKMYTQAGTKIDIDSANKLLGDKLGTAKGNIDEWSKASEIKKNFASSFCGDIYSVKGYDSSFRIIGISTNSDSGDKWAEIFECTKGITITSGKDVFGKLKMQGNALSMTYVQESDHKTPIYSINDNKLMNTFIDALNNTTPYLFESNHIPNLDWNNPADFRHIRIKLKDGCDVKLTLTKGEYILYGNCDAVFKMNSSKFHELWDKLDYTKDISVKQHVK
jgi:hypothetical protein